MNDSALDVVRRKLEFSRSCVESLNKASRESQYPDNVSLFEDLAKVFESYVLTFERILKLEDEHELLLGKRSAKMVVVGRRVCRPRARATFGK